MGVSLFHQSQTKLTKMTTKEFLSENRECVINYYNTEIKTYWTISLSAFATDLLNNFRKITTCDEFKKYDLVGNLEEAKQRLGLFNKCTVEAEDKVTDRLRSKYNGTSYMALV
jgi:hypothetical protein